MANKGATVGYYEIRRAVKHEHQKKTWWMRVGSATLLDTGTIMARLEAVPLNWDGTFHLFPSKAGRKRVRGVAKKIQQPSPMAN